MNILKYNKKKVNKIFKLLTIKRNPLGHRTLNANSVLNKLNRNKNIQIDIRCLKSICVCCAESECPKSE